MNPIEKTPVFILAGGFGTRMSEDAKQIPKPMTEIGGIPILVHLMRWYYSFGFSDFVLCVGHRAWDIKDYFLNYASRQNHLCIDHRKNASNPAIPFGNNLQEKWRVTMVDTGAETMTGARLARAIDEFGKFEKFENLALTYGDGLADVDLRAELDFHHAHKRIGTVLGVVPPSRFGELSVGANAQVRSFLEKPTSKSSLISGGFFFFKKDIRHYLKTASTCVLEDKPLTKLAQEQQLMTFRHPGFWQCMDTPRDRNQLQKIWDSGQAPWLRVDADAEPESIAA